MTSDAGAGIGYTAIRIRGIAYNQLTLQSMEYHLMMPNRMELTG